MEKLLSLIETEKPFYKNGVKYEFSSYDEKNGRVAYGINDFWTYHDDIKDILKLLGSL